MHGHSAIEFHNSVLARLSLLLGWGLIALFRGVGINTVFIIHQQGFPALPGIFSKPAANSKLTTKSKTAAKFKPNQKPETAATSKPAAKLYPKSKSIQPPRNDCFSSRKKFLIRKLLWPTSSVNNHFFILILHFVNNCEARLFTRNLITSPFSVVKSTIQAV